MLIPVRTIILICVGVTSTTLDCINWKLMWVCLIDILSISPLSEQKKVTMFFFFKHSVQHDFLAINYSFIFFFCKLGEVAKIALQLHLTTETLGEGAIAYSTQCMYMYEIILNQKIHTCTALEFQEMESRELKQTRTATPTLGSKKSISF